MRPEEALAIGQAIERYCLLDPPRFALNLGSGDVVQLLDKKPWIKDHLFSKLEKAGCNVIHSDIRQTPGVDEPVDLTNRDATLAFGSRYPGRRVVFLCNVLEHIPKKLVNSLLDGVSTLVSRDDHLIVSVPKRYPFHPDPIDTLFRPDPSSIKALFPALDAVCEGVIQSGNYWQELKVMPPLKRLRRLLRPLFPVSSLGRYLSDVHRLSFLWRPYEISYVVFRRTR